MYAKGRALPKTLEKPMDFVKVKKRVSFVKMNRLFTVPTVNQG